MKKKIISVISLLMSSTMLFACNDKATGTNMFEYEETTLDTNKKLDMDANFVIDGKNNNEYDNVRSYSFEESKTGMVVESKAYLGEKGLFVYSYVDDTSIYVSSEKAFYQNDSIEFYIDPNPLKSMSLSELNDGVVVNTDCIQLRINALGECEKWYGRQVGGKGTYPWIQGYFDATTAAYIDGEFNTKEGAKGYGVEAFIPYEAMNLTSKPEEIGLMVAFNNIENREDTSRRWFTSKGMSHDAVTSYARVDSNGFKDYSYTPKKALTANFEDVTYSTCKEIVLYEVDDANRNEYARGKVKAALGEDGIYFTVNVKDKVKSYLSDNIWANDGIEIVIDANDSRKDVFYVDGIYRFGMDVTGGISTDICITGRKDYVPVKRNVAGKVETKEIKDSSIFGYKYEYTYELMVPYETIDLNEKPDSITFAFAVKTPNEKAYIYNRKNGVGLMEAQDWLWVDKRYPLNPSEYYQLTVDGIYEQFVTTYKFPEWTPFEDCIIRADAKERYDVRGYAANNGLFINMQQYVDTLQRDGDKWTQQHHVEFEIWQGDFGWGWGGTYFAFFLDNSYYINNETNVFDLQYKTMVIDNGEDYEGYRYTISYEIYIGFNNNIQSSDGPYGFVKAMSYTPTETTGYENATTIIKDKGMASQRTLWTDACNSYEFRLGGIVRIDRG